MEGVSRWLTDFDWRSPELPLTQWYYPVCGGAVYATVMILWRARVLAAKKKAQGTAATGDGSTARGGNAGERRGQGGAKKPLGPWNFVMAAHNALLSAASLTMLLGFASSAYARGLAGDGGGASWADWRWMMCETVGTRSTGPLFAWAYLYYLSKYWEFVDTFLALAKGSVPRHFWLHVFHHSCVVVMAWLWVEYQQSLHTIGAMFNCLVHVFMYLYYALTSLGLRPWWKRAITALQNVQFMTSFGLLLGTAYLIREGHVCAGMPALAFNTCFNAVLLSQFLKVLFPKRSSSPGKDKDKVKRT